MQVMNLPNAFDIANPVQWVLEKRPTKMIAPGIEYGAWSRLGSPIGNAWGVSNPTQWIVELRPEVMWQTWFAPGGSLGRTFLPQVTLRT
jgi:hypothetical protein